MSTEDAIREAGMTFINDGGLPRERNIADGLFAIAEAINGLTSSIHKLGTNDAATSMGAIEALAERVGQSIDGLAGGTFSVRIDT